MSAQLEDRFDSSSFGRVPHFQMLAVMVLSQHRVSSRHLKPSVHVFLWVPDVRGMSE